MKRRIFIALVLKEEAVLQLKKVLKEIPGKKVAVDKWHFTLAFLGDVQEEQLVSLFQVFNELPLPQPIKITLEKIGVFPRSKSAKIVWVGVNHGESAITQLAELCKACLSQAHFNIEDRDFVPHVTISRLYHPENISKWVEKHPRFKVDAILDTIILYESILEPQGSRYQILAQRSLTH